MYLSEAGSDSYMTIERLGYSKGENQLAVATPDETKHPANRRAEIKILN